MVSPEKYYSKFGSFWVYIFGVSYVPLKVEFRCRVCGEVFDRTEQPEELKRYV